MRVVSGGIMYKKKVSKEKLTLVIRLAIALHRDALIELGKR